MKSRIVVAILPLLILSSVILRGELIDDLHFSQSDLQFSKDKGYDVVNVKGCPDASEMLAGPRLPAKRITFVIPQNTKVEYVDILNSDYEIVPGQYDIYPSQLPEPVEEESLPFVSPNPIVYASHESFPRELVKIIHEEYRSGFKLVTLKVYPLHYIPKDRKLLLFTNISFQLILTSDSNNAVPVYRRSEFSQKVIEKVIRSIVVNPEDVSADMGGADCIVRHSSKMERLSIREFPSMEGIPVDYVIIASDGQLEDLQILEDWKTKTGIVTVVKSLSWIETNYHGCDTQEKVRNFIKDAYSYWGTIWLLLVGDTQIMPARPAYTVKMQPTDLYFSGIDGNWNANANTIFGENRMRALSSVSFADPCNGWIASQRGEVMHTSDGGLTWDLQESGVNWDLNCICFPDAVNGWVVGFWGAIRNTKDGGKSWWWQQSQITKDLYGVYFVNSEKGWAVGLDGVVLQTIDGGQNWVDQVPAPQKTLMDVHFINEQLGWAVGEDGTIIHTEDGNQWVQQQVPPIPAELLNAVCFVDAENGWAVGSNNRILHTTDGGATQWEKQDPGIAETTDFLGVSFINESIGWIVGKEGIILHTTDGGDNWVEQESEVPGAWLFDIFSFDANRCFAVGATEIEEILRFGVALSTENGGSTWKGITPIPPDFADFYPDLFLGRAPVENVDELNLFINKIFKYERDPELGYLTKILYLAGSAHDGDGRGPRNMDSLAYEEWYEFTNLPNFTSWKLYGPKHNAGWQGDEELTSANMRDALNDGYNLVIHMDHSREYCLGAGWETGGGLMCRNDMDILSNQTKYSVLWTGGCSPNAFNYDCVTEHFINAEDGGGVALIGNTTIGLWNDYPQYYEFLRSLFATSVHYIGPAFSSTQNIGLPYQSPFCAANSNLLGDPTMAVWTDSPHHFMVDMPHEIEGLGMKTIVITIRDFETGTAVEGALVCLQKGNEAYGRELTNESGEATFHYKPESTGEIDVTVTAINYVPFEGEIEVKLTTLVPFVCFESSIVDDNNVGQSIGNGDCVVNPGETIEMHLILKNNGTADAGEVSATLSLPPVPVPTPIEILVDRQEFGDISANGGTSQSFNPYVFRVLPDCEPDYEITFLLSIKDIDSNEWGDNFIVKVLSDSLYHTRHIVTINDINGNGVLDPNEKVYIDSLEIANYGNGGADEVEAKLTPEVPGITMEKDYCFVGDIPGFSFVTCAEPGPEPHCFIFRCDPVPLEFNSR